MVDKLRFLDELGAAVAKSRADIQFSVVNIARKAGGSRIVQLNSERGRDVTVGSLFNLLRAMGLCVRLDNDGMPALEEMQNRCSYKQ